MMTRFKPLLFCCLPLALLSLLLVPTTVWGHALHPRTTLSAAAETLLVGVAAVSPKDVWAVGRFTTSSNQEQTLTEHWDGTTWTRVASPNTLGDFNALDGITAITHNNVWAVGDSGQLQPLIEHWNGSRWSIMPSPALAGSLTGITAVSSTNLWAVGSNDSGNTIQPLIEHWNGSAWSIVTSPNIAADGSLSKVTAVASNNIWAVGSIFALPLSHPLIEHWNGISWSVVPGPTISSALPSSQLDGIATVSKNDIWAVGHSDGGTDASMHNTLTLHWNGARWSVVASFNLSVYAALHDVAALSSTNVWAVGYYDNSVNRYPLILHWLGKTWQVVSVVRLPNYSALNGVTALSRQDAWAVGENSTHAGMGGFQQLRVHWDGSSWLSK